MLAQTKNSGFAESQISGRTIKTIAYPWRRDVITYTYKIKKKDFKKSKENEVKLNWL